VGKITSKYQVSLPKALADRLGVRPGDEVEWRIAGDELRVAPHRRRAELSLEKRLQMFDEAKKRQASRNKGRRVRGGSRGWTREELYDRGRTR